MRKQFKIDLWEYDIEEEKNAYGYKLIIYRSNKKVFNLSGFGSYGTAEAYATTYIIENQFNIELNREEN